MTKKLRTLMITLLPGLALAVMAVDAGASPAPVTSCTFTGDFADGCSDFTGTAWTPEAIAGFCADQAREGTTADMKTGSCLDEPAAGYDTVCRVDKGDGLEVDHYGVGMPAIICTLFLGGTPEEISPDAGS